MKIIKKSFAVLLITLLSISNLFAAGIPDEPMIIYGSVISTTWNKISIYDWNNNLIKEVDIKSWKYWTNKTFDNTSKIRLETFSWELTFKLNDVVGTVTKWGDSNCSNQALFQKWNICEYNLNFISVTWDNFSSLFKWNIKWDDMVIEEKYKTENINEIFNWKIFEKNRNIVKNNIWENIVRNISDNDNIIVTSNKLEISKKINNKIILINNSKKEALYIPENTEIIQEDVIIEKPVKITNTSNIKNKINKKIIGAVEISTNKRVNFEKDIRICTELTSTQTKAFNIYYSHDNINWILENNAQNIEISNWQICFDVNHLTSFAIWEDDDNSSSNNTSSSSSWWNSNQSYELANNSAVTIKNNKNEISKINETKIIDIKKVDDEKIIKTEKVNDSEWLLGNTDSASLELQEKQIKNKIKNVKFMKADFTIQSKDYIKTLKQFKKEKELQLSISGYKVLKIIWEPKYNEQIDLYAIQIFNDIKNKDIRESMFSHLNKMTTTYWIYTNNNLDPKLIDIYEKLLIINTNNFEFKLEKLKFKDYIINKAINTRLEKELKNMPAIID